MLSSVKKHSMSCVLALMMLQMLLNANLASQGSVGYTKML